MPRAARSASRVVALAATARPWPCHILAVDPGQTSGVALFHAGELIYATELDIRPSGVAASMVKAALCRAIDSGLPLFLVSESWGCGGRMGLAQWQGLGGAWQVWRWAAETVRMDGKRIAASRIIRVPVNTWRKAVLGKGNMPTDQAKASAVAHVKQRYMVFGLDGIGHNAAEAVCIGLWGTMAAKVGEKIPRGTMAKWQAEQEHRRTA